MTNPLPNGVTDLAIRLRQKERREADAHRIASAAARADRTDPFTYDRVFSRILNGIGEEYVFGEPK